MTTIELDHSAAPAVAVAPSTRPGLFARPSHIIVLVLVVVGIAAAALVLYVDRKTAPATAGTIPAVHVEVGGDVARTSGNATYSDGSTVELQQGENSYTADLGRSLPARGVSVAVVSGFGPAWCTITVDGQLATRVDAESGGELAVCTWTQP